MFSSIAVASQNPTVQDYLVPQILSTNKGWYGINNTYNTFTPYIKGCRCGITWISAHLAVV